MSGYVDFARFYDALTDDIDYRYIAQYYHQINQKFGGFVGIMLDLGCGTGKLSRQLSLLGYDVIGVDNSAEMLNIAVENEHDGIEYLCQDMCELDLFGTIDATISSLDSLNHLSNTDEIIDAFKKVSLFSNPSALFMFDVNTPFKHRNILAEQTFVYDLDSLYCVWQNSEIIDENNKIEMYLDFFAADKNGFYQRYFDEFSEIAPDLSFFKSALKSTGFDFVAAYDYLTFDAPTEKSEKLTIIARKI